MTCSLGDVEVPNPRCDRSGNLPACQLCPNSPTYWRPAARTPAADPYHRADNPRVLLPSPPAGPYDQYMIDGRRDRWSTGPPQPCVICLKPAIMYSPKGPPCHKTCAEQWNRTHDRPTTPAA